MRQNLAGQRAGQRDVERRGWRERGQALLILTFSAAPFRLIVSLAFSMATSSVSTAQTS